jgi:deoxycytidylate deaminase
VFRQINYPYIPQGQVILYVNVSNHYMALAREFARENSLDAVMPGAAVVVRDGIVLGAGANGSDYHSHHECQRIILGCKSGEGYELCEGCHPKNHSEPSAIRDAVTRGNDTNGADLYLWGHWWCCKSCWDAMTQAGIRRVFLLENSSVLFNKEHPDNVVGKQFSF